MSFQELGKAADDFMPVFGVIIIGFILIVGAAALRDWFRKKRR